VLQWNDSSCIGFIEEKKPYLIYDVIIECKNLNPVKISKKQINLYNKICKFRGDGLTFKEISDKLNFLSYKPIRGEVGGFTPQKVWSNFKKIKKHQERKVETISMDIKNLRIVWK